jgi:RluA family pseudouridine synthase
MLKRKINKEVRLQEAAVGLFPELPSRKSVKKAITNNQIHINGKPGKTSTWVLEGDKIEYKSPELSSDTNRSNNKYTLNKSDILYQDFSIIIILKRGGVITNGNYKHTLDKDTINYLISNDLNNNIKHFGPAHRLDKETHGPVIFYKDLETANWLGKSFENREIKKTYLALVEGELTLQKAIINTPLYGKQSESIIENIGTITWPLHGKATLVKIYPITGRKHQIRLHLSSIGHPVVGDKQYNSGERYTGSGLFLACTSLSFTNKISQLEIDVTAAPPRKFNKVFSKLDLS